MEQKLVLFENPKNGFNPDITKTTIQKYLDDGWHVAQLSAVHIGMCGTACYILMEKEKQ